jgi:hypothetical protein
MSKRPLAIPLLLGVFVAACADQPAPTDIPDAAYSYVNNPDIGNPRIVRIEGTWGYLLVDPANDMFAIIHSRNNLRGCNTQAIIYSFMEEQALFHNPDDPMGDKVSLIIHGRDVYMAVFEGYAAWYAGGRTCADLYASMVADGSGNLTETDNDYYSYLRPSNNANAYGYVANGKLDLLSGGKANFHGMSRCVWDGNDPATSRCTNKIMLH